MKKYIIILATLLSGIGQAQQVVNMNTYNNGSNANKYFKDLNNIFPNFVGTWEYVNGNQVFQVVLWQVTKVSYNGVDAGCFMDEIRGNFLMIENRGMPNEMVTYGSDKNYPGGVIKYVPAILFTPSSNNGGGILIDNCISSGPGEDPYVMVGLKFTIDTSTTPFKAHWQINDRRKNDLYIGEMPELSVPLDIVLTKVY